ncbi:hypothetical protein [Embleya sp. NPDC059237]|uniref:hypothetical protein n=1 Tax=Embleya sp. NPDC059237 TaxID=3346784 RepID=UPI00367D6971
MRGTTAAMGLAVLAVVAAGCDSGDSPSAKKTTQPSNTTSATPTSGAGGVALTTYRSLWAAATKAALTSDYENPELREYAHDDALAYFVGSNLNNKEKGLVAKGEPVIAPRVVAEAGDKVTVADCVDGSNWLKYRLSDGKLADDVPGGHHRAEATVTRTTVGWRVTHLTIEEVGSC